MITFYEYLKLNHKLDKLNIFVQNFGRLSDPNYKNTLVAYIKFCNSLKNVPNLTKDERKKLADFEKVILEPFNYIQSMLKKYKSPGNDSLEGYDGVIKCIRKYDGNYLSGFHSICSSMVGDYKNGNIPEHPFEFILNFKDALTKFRNSKSKQNTSVSVLFGFLQRNNSEFRKNSRIKKVYLQLLRLTTKHREVNDFISDTLKSNNNDLAENVGKFITITQNLLKMMNTDDDESDLLNYLSDYNNFS